ncbi:CRP-like cAMP-binding protein [Winogradskyella epiphytica]|uniref:CRP-like cAMP-binding protein n=1 Tax=Winogradskyella epiphytica TaxID=262005 RepID=A0A2V4XG54_9FLAO|nr:Crp/Fnr family transcriptional regulator [Winogradskyella epiphytica]PYE81844.1 CRP-like cAMP-binding protein [Winogradskyella epiphytica]GGW62255.1 cAMP-binding protein [Winogradskyella epiphytica]
MNISDFLMSLVSFSKDELNDILNHFEKESVLKNEVLVQQGDICNYLYYVEQGMGRSYYLNESGREITQWFFGVGKFMTSADSFFQKSPSLYYLEVLEDSVLYRISKSNIDKLFEKYPKMEKLGRLASIEMLTRVVNKLNAIQFQTAKERYDYMLAEFPDIVYQVPLGHIASYLGMSQETLSRIRKNEPKIM